MGWDPVWSRGCAASPGPAASSREPLGPERVLSEPQAGVDLGAAGCPWIWYRRIDFGAT